MKNNKKIFILFLFILSSFALNANLNDILNSKKNYQIYSGNNNEKTFNAVRYINNNYSKEKIKAKNIYSTSKIDLYLENDLKVEDLNRYTGALISINTYSFNITVNMSKSIKLMSTGSDKLYGTVILPDG